MRWGRINNGNCSLCSKIQSNKHVLSNCSSDHALKRYRGRHDAVLEIIAKWISDSITNGHALHADLPDNRFKPLSEIFQNLRPDIAIIWKKVVVALELTICHESNMVNSKEYKLNKYQNLRANLISAFSQYTVKLFTIEVPTLGFISNVNDFTKAVSISNLPFSVKSLITGKVVTSSREIYLARNQTT